MNPSPPAPRWARVLRRAYLLSGVALLLLVLSRVDLGEVLAQVALVGALGLAAVVLVYFFAFLLDSFTWQMALVQVPLDLRWLARTFKVRLVGEVFNTVMPAGGIGGEPLKAELLRRHYGIGYAAGIASLVLGKTINMVSQVVFLAVGFALVMLSALPPAYKLVAGAGLLAFSLATGLLFGAQRLRVGTRAGRRLASGGGALAGRAMAVLHHVADMDERLVAFYTRHRGRFGFALVLALGNWVAGALEVWITLWFLQRPVTFAEAWIIEALAQLVRAGAFFVPAAIGVQEAAFLLVCGVITGSPATGVAVSVVRRARELIWLLWGGLLGACFSASARRMARSAAAAGATHHPSENNP